MLNSTIVVQKYIVVLFFCDWLLSRGRPARQFGVPKEAMISKGRQLRITMTRSSEPPVYRILNYFARDFVCHRSVDHLISRISIIASDLVLSVRV